MTLPQVTTIKLNDGYYPELLKKIYDPPKELYIKGDVELLSSKCIAIVGTRKATNYGKDIANRFAQGLAAHGITIVSGMAEGIDTAAHLGALEAKGRTIAVFGCGLDTIFPASNIELAKEIEDHGALVSEFPAEHPTTKWTFPRRNRIISGLSIGVVMVEGHYDSGAMITAKHAIDEGRDVFAVPGNIELDQTKGPHWLIKQGAKLVESVDDILEEYGIVMSVDPAKKRELDISLLNDDEKKILQKLDKQPKHIDDIATLIGQDISYVLSVISLLEIKGHVRQLPGKYFITS